MGNDEVVEILQKCLESFLNNLYLCGRLFVIWTGGRDMAG